MGKWSILVSNGYFLEYVTTVDAKSAKEARKLFLKREAGTHYAAAVERNPKNMRATRQPETPAN